MIAWFLKYIFWWSLHTCSIVIQMMWSNLLKGHQMNIIGKFCLTSGTRYHISCLSTLLTMTNDGDKPWLTRKAHFLELRNSTLRFQRVKVVIGKLSTIRPLTKRIFSPSPHGKFIHDSRVLGKLGSMRVRKVSSKMLLNCPKFDKNMLSALYSQNL